MQATSRERAAKAPQAPCPRSPRRVAPSGISDLSPRRWMHRPIRRAPQAHQRALIRPLGIFDPLTSHSRSFP
jgi:hypothetical protein